MQNDKSKEWPQLWGWDNGSIYYGPGDGKNDRRIQDYPELFAELKEACKRFFEKKSATE